MSPEIWVYDVETSPNLVYTWGLFDQNVGLNQIVKSQDILCFAATKIGTGKVVSAASWDGYESMLQKLWNMMDSCDILCGYNQASFDDKLVKAAFVKAGMPPPSPYRSIDLLKVVKRSFKFPSHRLAYVCEALGLNLKTDPGGFNTWKHILDPESPDREAAQRRLVKYCRNDVKITAELFELLTPWIPNLNIPAYRDDDELHCTRCDSTKLHARGLAHTATLSYQRYRCMDCGGWMRGAKAFPRKNQLLRNA